MENEGRLYKKIELHGKTFEIYYGYYDESDKKSPYNESVPIYPNFDEEPIYTDNGERFVTAMQDKCEGFVGKETGDSCISCQHFEKGDDLIGVCTR